MQRERGFCASGLATQQAVDGRLWEAPSRFMGQKVSIRHPEGEPESLHLFEGGEPVCRLHPVRLAENADRPPALRFSLQPQAEEEEQP
jgi:hypothetical protein